MTYTKDKNRMSHNVCYAKSYHLVKGADSCAVYPASSFEDGIYSGSPLVTGDFETCRAYLEGLDLSFSVVVCGFIVPHRFVSDLCRLADRIRDELDGVLSKEHLTLHSDCVVRGSFNHCYIGDMGACACIRGENVSREALALLARLIGISEAAWELGFTVCYDENGGHHVLRSSEYVRSMED